MTPSPSKLLFIPGLHKITAGPGPRPSQPPPSARFFCPSVSRHALVTPPSPSLSRSATRRANPPRGRRVAPQAVVAPAPLPSATRSTLQLRNPLLPPQPLLPPPTPADSVRVVGHKHTAESKRKISAANRGNVPWNKGRRHTEETKRKISEATRRAMLQPEMRRLLKERAKGRKHSEATKLKIRETARATRGGCGTAKRSKKVPVPFTFPPEVVADLNGKVQRQLETSFKKVDDSQRLMIREKRPMLEETKAKLSARIKELWTDPDYRNKVAEGNEQRAVRMGRARSRDKSPSPERSRADADDLLPLVSTKVKREPTTTTAKSPKRRARVKTARVASDDDDHDAAVFDEIDDSEIFLDPESLVGMTKEDLGIFGTHGAGRVQTGSRCNDPIMTDAESDDGLSRVVPDNALREHHTDLLASLADAGQAQPLVQQPYMDMSRSHGGFEGLNAEVHATTVAPLDVAHANDAGHEFAQGTTVPGYRQDSARQEVLELFDGPAHPMSPSATEPSPFVSVGSAVDEDRIAPAVSPDFDFSSGGEHLIGQNSGAGYGQDNLSLNYVDENFGGLDIYNEAGTPFGNALTAGPSVDFDHQSGQLAKNPGKEK